MAFLGAVDESRSLSTLGVFVQVHSLKMDGFVDTVDESHMVMFSTPSLSTLGVCVQVDTLKMDGFLQCLKQEVELMSRMVMCMDAFTTDQTRLVVIVDGLDSCEQGKVVRPKQSLKPYGCCCLSDL